MFDHFFNTILEIAYFFGFKDFTEEQVVDAYVDFDDFLRVILQLAIDTIDA